VCRRLRGCYVFRGSFPRASAPGLGSATPPGLLGYVTSARRELALTGVWQAKPTNHRIRDAADYEKHRDYIFENPVRAGLAPYAEDFPFSYAKRRENLDPRPPALKRKT
jgi:hypothetical protein